MSGESLVFLLERGRGNVVRATPYKHLLLAMLRCSLSFVQSLKGAIVTLIQAPVAVNGNPDNIKKLCTVKRNIMMMQHTSRGSSRPEQ